MRTPPLPHRVRSGPAVTPEPDALAACETRLGALFDQAGEERFRMLAEMMPAAVWATDSVGHILWGNERWHSFTGRDAGDAQLTFMDKLHPSARALFEMRLSDARAANQRLRCEALLRDEYDNYRWFLIEARLMLNSQGELLHWLGSATDIHEHQVLLQSERRERAHAQEARNRFRQVLRQVPLALAVFRDGSHTIEAATELAEKLFARNLLGRDAREAFPELDSSHAFAILDRVYETGDSFERDGLRVVFDRVDGEPQEHLFDVKCHALIDSFDEICGVVAIGFDVTAATRTRHDLERASREAERARAEAEQERAQLTRVLEQAPFACSVVLGPDHIVKSVNERHRWLIGPRESLNLPLRTVFPEATMAGVHAMLDQAFATGRTEIVREQAVGWIRPDTGSIEQGHFDVIYQPIRTASGEVEGVMSFGVDVSANVSARAVAEAARAELLDGQRQLELHIEERTAQLAQLNTALAAEIAVRTEAEAKRLELQRRLATAREDEQRRTARDLHDQFGQTLSALMLAVKSACDLEPLPAATAARLADALRLAEELGRDVHDLAARLRPVLLDDLGLHAALRQLLRGWARRSRVEVDFQADWLQHQRLPSEIETVLYRVVQEAVTNIARHARARHVSVVVEAHDGQVIAVIEDDGVGFDPVRAGSGRLGLVGMRERVELVSGTVDIESEADQGTTVIARVPLEREAFDADRGHNLTLLEADSDG